MEATALLLTAALLLLLGRQWWEWQQQLAGGGLLEDWARRILAGDRALSTPPGTMNESDRTVFAALQAVVGESQAYRQDLARLQQAADREWKDLDGLLGSIQRLHEEEVLTRTQGAAQLGALGRDLKANLEEAAKVEFLGANHHLEADQHRMQSQSFRAVLGQSRAGLEQFEALLQQLQDTFPRLRREEDALGRLADAGLRQGTRLTMAMNGLVAHTPQLIEESQARFEWLKRFRAAADGVRGQSEVLARRIETFREQAQTRTRSFEVARGTLGELDQVAQQTGLLAVNAAILAQQEAGSLGMTAIGGQLHALAGQMVAGASGLERSLEEYHQGLERETAEFWDLQEVAERLFSHMAELTRMTGQLDQQSQDLERSLETHLGLVDQVRQASEQAGVSLHEIGERAFGLESALGRQWGVEAKFIPERERLSRVTARLGGMGDELALASQRSVEAVWEILQRQQSLRRTEAYRQIVSGESKGLLSQAPEDVPTWSRIAWARAERRPRLLAALAGPGPLCRTKPNGELALMLVGQDALGHLEPSALAAWDCDLTGQTWGLHLRESLRAETHRLGLLEAVMNSPLPTCLPGLDARIITEGVELRLAFPYPGFPGFLAGLDLDLPVEQADLSPGTRPWQPRLMPVQHLLWLGPGNGGGLDHPALRLVHTRVKDDARHASCLSWLTYEGQRPPCPLLGSEEVVPDRLAEPLAVQCLGLGADPECLFPLRDFLLEVGAVDGIGGAVLCAVGLGQAHPAALLLRLFQPNAAMAGALHPELIPYQIRLREEVLAANSPDPYRAAWSILEDLQRAGWLLPLPPT